ncbi:MAG: FixH family protein [Pseudomonadota bacterium]
MSISQDNKQALRNPWVLGWLGLLSVVVLVNVAFIVTAFKTDPGLVEKDYYEKGRYQEETFTQQLEARKRLGWDITLQSPEKIVAGSSTSYSVSIVDRIGQPLKEAQVSMQAYRPSDASADIYAEMDRVARGVYQTRLNLPLKGIWDLKVVVKRGEDELEIARRINVAAP